MTKLRLLLISLVLLAVCGVPASAALFSSEAKSLDAARESFRLELWERAEREFSEFVKDFPKSEKISEALLLQAQAQFRQKKYAAVVDLLNSRQPQAGAAADQFLYWVATAQFTQGDYADAGASFGKLAREFPASARRLEAAVKEADAAAKLKNWDRVRDLLKQPSGPFRLSVAVTPKASEWVASGFLLLAEAQLAAKDFPGAEVSLGKVAEGLSSDLEWRRRYLLCRTLAEGGKADEAARESAGMIKAAEATKQWELVSDSVIFRAELLEQLGRWTDAMETWAMNFTNAPIARQRQALTRSVAAAIKQNQLDTAIQVLERFIAQFTNAPAADVALLTLGEIHLKQHVGVIPTVGTNETVSHWESATNCFYRLLKGFPGSAYLGKAQLNLGWCYWVQNDFVASEAAFDAAVKRLPASEEQVVARFKLADAQFAQTNYPQAMENYREVLRVITNYPSANGALRTPASYQALRASLALTNAAGAEQAMRVILADDSASEEAMSGVLLVAQAYVDANQPKEAQRMFGEFALEFPDSDLRPEVELLVARLQEGQGEWSKAVAAYDAWLGRYPTNRLHIQVEFQRALASAGLGEETNALQRMTNFLARYPNHELAPEAQWWVADYYFGREDYVAAELNYKQLFQTWRNLELAYEAQMMAGRAAVRRSGYNSAIEHFTALTSDTNCPTRLRLQAFFGHGGALVLSVSTSTNKLETWNQARQVYAAVVKEFPTNEMAAAAYGEIGNCALQLAANDSSFYQTASNAYYQAFTFPTASVEVRSQAKCGLALVLEKQGALLGGEEQQQLLRAAREHVMDVYAGKNPGGAPVEFWRKRAGLEAARLSEALNEWRPAVQIYRDLQRQKLQPNEAMEKKVANAQDKLQASAKSE